MNKLILVLNFGSSSLKFSVISNKNYFIKLKGIIEFSNFEKTKISWKIFEKDYNSTIYKNFSYEDALNFLLVNILKKQPEIFFNIDCIGHRIVHGGREIKTSVLITNKILEYIKDACKFSPLHNPINLLGIKASFNIFPNLKKKNVAVFDTSFHSYISKVAYLYAIPYEFYTKYGIKKYGAHGISCQYSMYRSSKILDIKISDLNLIICHLGSGASVSVVKKGVCIDTSMGLTPLEGLVMGTRSGDIDPSIIFFMHQELKLSMNEISNIIIYKSGLFGLSGISNDCRDLENKYGYDSRSKLAIDVFCYRLLKYISFYISLVSGKLNAIVFTGGIGENSDLIRTIIISKLSFLGFKLDVKKNLLVRFGKEGFINEVNTIPILVIPSNEDLVIARESFSVIKKFFKDEISK